MGKVLPFKKKSLAAKQKAKTLCKSGFHKWEIVTDRKFDVKQGRLVTLFSCQRCGATKTKLK